MVKHKKILFSMLLFVLLCSIACVSAENVENNNTLALNDEEASSMGAPINDGNGNGTIEYTVNGGEKLQSTSNGEGVYSIKDGDSDLAVSLDSDVDTSEVIDFKTTASPTINTHFLSVSSLKRVATDFNAGERGQLFEIYLLDSSNVPLSNKVIQIGLNGVIYNRTTDAMGMASLRINLAGAGDYTYAFFFYGEDNYAACFDVYKLTITKKTTSITPAKTSYSFKASAKTKTIKATMTTSKSPSDGKMYLKEGKKVTLTVNGKTYSAKTGKNGAISLNIGGLAKKGTYKVQIKFAGDNTYKSSTSKTITVKIT